jgi:hypothetical protein
MTDLNDSLDDIFGSPSGEVRIEPVRPNAIEYKPATTRFEEGCDKCRGSGKFVSYTGRIVGNCFACKGAGKKVFKTSPATREQNRERAMERKERIATQSVADFKAANQAEYEWLVATAPRWDVAASLLAGLHRYGDLTEKQIALVRNGIARDLARVTERSHRTASAPSVDTAGIDRLKEAFDKAIAYSAEKGLKLSPRITIDGMTISPAKANSANPGALYVKAGQTYLGKVAQGKFFAARECTAADTAKVQTFIANPAEAAKVYGQTTGTCCVCNATLRSDWKLRGIGPICAEKFGW